jgi:hypothetical protein
VHGKVNLNRDSSLKNILLDMVNKGDNNIVEDTLNRLPKQLKSLEDSQFVFFSVIEWYGRQQNDRPKHYFHPLSFAHWEAEEQSDSLLKKELQNKTCSIMPKYFLEGGKLDHSFATKWLHQKTTKLCD